MSRLVLVAALAVAAGCAAETEPTWAFDPIWLEPAADGDVHGFQTWQLYGPKWIDNSDPDTYACAVVVELFGAATECDADPGCTVAWDVAEAEVASSDCPENLLADPLFLSLRRIGLGGADGSPEAPWPGQTSVGRADYGNGWEIHGYAYPEALDLGATLDTAEWDGVQPYLMVPTQSFELGAAPAATPGAGG